MRFRGFTDAWEQREVGEIVKKLKSYPLSRDVETKERTGYRYIHYGDIHKQIADLIVQDEDLPSIKEGDYIPLNQGDLVLADVSEDYTGIAEPSIILHEPKTKIIAGLHTIAIRPQSATSLYLYYLLHTERFKKFGSHVGTGLKVFGITFNNLSLFQIKTPSFPEQTAIGNFFRTLDDTITLHKRKLDKLKELKKAYLQRMFPQAGNDVPKVRFAGFTEPWASRKLGEVAEIVRGASPRPIQDPKWFDEKSNVGWLRISDVSVQDGRVHYLEQHISKAGQKKTRVLTQPHLLLSIAASVGKPVINYVNTGVHDGFLIFQNPNFEIEFMFQWLKMFEEQWLKYGQPGSQINLNSDIVKNQDISIPTKEEQKHIGNLFLNLDNQVFVRQQKLDQLNQLKRSYL
ncbi:MAG: restriction endonuclease subunit S, partial [Bacillota bacterium]